MIPELYDAVCDINRRSHYASDKTCLKAVRLSKKVVEQHAGLYGVPSSDGQTYHAVTLAGSHLTCTCMGYKIRRICAHVLATGIHIQRYPRLAGCGKPPVPHGYLLAGML